MKCPACEHELKLAGKLVSQSRDEIKTYTHQWWRCRHCRKVWYGELTEYVFDDSYEHVLFEAGLEIWNTDLRTVKKCRNPQNVHCACRAHTGDLSSHYEKRVLYSFDK